MTTKKILSGNGEIVILTSQIRYRGLGEEIKVIYQDGTEDFVFVNDLID